MKDAQNITIQKENDMPKEIAPKPQEVKQEVKIEKGYIVYADFELHKTSHKKGDHFTPPADYIPVPRVEEIAKVGQKSRGIAFSYQGQTVILPIE